jgi:hypothetical protein
MELFRSSAVQVFGEYGFSLGEIRFRVKQPLYIKIALILSIILLLKSQTRIIMGNLMLIVLPFRSHIHFVKGFASILQILAPICAVNRRVSFLLIKALTNNEITI